MPTPNFKPLGSDPSTKEIQDYIVKLIRDLNFMLGNLDTLNVNRLDAKVIEAETITAGKLAADSVETANLQAGVVTADKITVTELSAIAANLGTITAGIINAVTINGATINITDDVTIGNNLNVGFGTNDRLIGLGSALISSISGVLNLDSPLGEVSSTATGQIQLNSQVSDIILNAPNGNVTVTSSVGTITDLVTAINSLNSSVSSLTSSLAGKVSSGSSTSSTSVSDGHNHGIANGTQLLDADGVTVHTWVSYAGSASHSHTV